MTKGQRMKANTNSRWAPHTVEHNWNGGCDTDPPCEPLVLSQADLGNHIDFGRAPGEPYWIEAKDFDIDKHEVQKLNDVGSECIGWGPLESLDTLPKNSLVVVRDKPKTLEEVIRESHGNTYRHRLLDNTTPRIDDLFLQNLVSDLRQAFPELADK
jgi:hypothetical protein